MEEAVNDWAQRSVAHRRAALTAIPHSRRIRRCDAQDVADELIRRCQEIHRPQALFVLPTGEFGFASVDEPEFVECFTEFNRMFCGVYTDDVCRGVVVDDIRARCEDIGIEWFDS